METYDKLVRDKIPEIIHASGSFSNTHVANEGEFRTKLYEKLEEEAKELVAQPSVDEAADLLEVLLAVCELEGWSIESLGATRSTKRNERGAFTERIILDAVS